jgi:hypothetical protein|tara:strand:+ start:951 stop:1313 length:363 start_codon:yes stop_codon:yes gene_type:complete
MATFSKELLSASTDGRAIKVAATATAGTLIHTGSTTATTIDELWLYAVNTDATDRKLTLEWGGVTVPDDLIEITIGAEAGLVLLAPGLLIKGNSTALLVRAFAATANVVDIHGYVNRITA